SGSFSAPGRQTAELVGQVPAACRRSNASDRRSGLIASMTGITAQRCVCSTDPGKRRQEPEAPSVTEEHLLLQLAARRPKQYANRRLRTIGDPLRPLTRNFPTSVLH